MEPLLVDRDAHPWQAGYWHIREGGFRPGKRCGCIATTRAGSSWSPLGRDLRATLGDTVVGLVHAIRRGRFPVCSADERCTGYCPLQHRLPRQPGPFSGEDMSTGSRPVNPSPWTDQQRRAITARGDSVALSAGAGCGKTFVLTERFLAELEPDGAATPPHLSQLVAITFTERAAREMRDRIRKACQQRLRGCSPERAGYWLALSARPGFGADQHDSRFLRGAFAGARRRGRHRPPLRRARCRPGRHAAVRTQRRGAAQPFGRARRAGAKLVTRFGLNRLRDMIARLLAQRTEIDWPLWTRETPEGLVARWEDFWRRDTVPRILRQISESAAARTVLDLAGRYPPAHPKMRERCDLLLDRLPKLGSSATDSRPGRALRDAAKVQGGGRKELGQ